MLMGKDEETAMGVLCSAMKACFSFEVGCSMFDVHLDLGLSCLFRISANRLTRSPPKLLIPAAWEPPLLESWKARLTSAERAPTPVAFSAFEKMSTVALGCVPNELGTRLVTYLKSLV